MLSASSERGSPYLPACSPRRGSTRGPVRPVFIRKHSRPSRGAKPREADDTNLLRSGLTRLAREGRRDQGKANLARFLRCQPCRQRPGGRQRAQCPHFLFGAKEASAAAEYRGSGKGCHFGATRPRREGLQDGGHRGAEDGVTTRALAGEDYFC